MLFNSLVRSHICEDRPTAPLHQTAQFLRPLGVESKVFLLVPLERIEQTGNGVPCIPEKRNGLLTLHSGIMIALCATAGFVFGLIRRQPQFRMGSRGTTQRDFATPRMTRRTEK